MGIACEQAPKRRGVKKKSEQSVAAVFSSVGYARLASLADFLLRLAPVSGVNRKWTFCINQIHLGQWFCPLCKKSWGELSLLVLRLFKASFKAYWKGNEWPHFRMTWLEPLTCNSPIQVLLWPPAGFVLGSSEFRSSAMLVNTQLVCLWPVGIHLAVKFKLYELFVSRICSAPLASVL